MEPNLLATSTKKTKLLYDALFQSLRRALSDSTLGTDRQPGVLPTSKCNSWQLLSSSPTLANDKTDKFNASIPQTRPSARRVIRIWRSYLRGCGVRQVSPDVGMTLLDSKDLITANKYLQISGLKAPLLLVTQSGSFDHHHQEKVAPSVIMDKSRKSQPALSKLHSPFPTPSSAQSTSQPQPLSTPNRDSSTTEPPKPNPRSIIVHHEPTPTHTHPPTSAICCRELFARFRDGRWSLRRCDRPSFPPPARSPPSSRLSSGENTTRRSLTVRGLSSLPWSGHRANLCRDRLLPTEKCGNARQV